MEKRGNVVIAWPEDYVLEGEELETLTAKLAPRAEVISLIPEGPNIDPVVTEYETAIMTTLESLGRALSHRALKSIMGECLERSSPSQGYSVKRSSCMGIALDNLVRRGKVDESITKAQLCLPEPATR